jgi:hypothetical protein
MIGGVLADAQSSAAGIFTSAASGATAVILLVAAIIGFRQVMRLREQAAETNHKLVIIHDLVNHTLTESIESDLEATRVSLDTMTALTELQRKSGTDPHPETLAAMAGAKTKISRLTQELADRMTVAEQIVAQGRREPPTGDLTERRAAL